MKYTFFFTILALMLMASPVVGLSETYTLDADYEQGVLLNLNHDTPDQLKLNEGVSTYPVMWVANAGEDTLSKFDTTTGKELARYRTWIDMGYTHGAWEGPAPSRTAVDIHGNVYVANRHFDGKPASVMKILKDDWIDRNGDGILNTSVDLNNDGTISGEEILPLLDTNGNGIVDPDEITDERVAWVVQVGPAGALGRSLAIDNNEDIWVGLHNTQTYYKISSIDGAILEGPISVAPNRPYGCLVDKDGILWGSSLGSNLLRLNTTNTSDVVVYDHSAYGSNYGIALGNDKVYLGTYSGNTFIQFDPATNTFSTPATDKFSTLGIAVDSSGNILVGDSGGTKMVKFAPDGSVIWSVPAVPASEVRGVVVDSDDNVWAIHRDVSKVSKYSDVNGLHLGTYDTGISPYTYSDATGLGHQSAVDPWGTWTIVTDSGIAGTLWNTVSWTESVPEAASIEVKVRTADTEVGLESSSYAPVSNGAAFSATGRYIQTQVRFTASSAEESPVLYDLTVSSLSGSRLTIGNVVDITQDWGQEFELNHSVVAADANASNVNLSYDLSWIPKYEIGKLNEGDVGWANQTVSNSTVQLVTVRANANSTDNDASNDTEMFQINITKRDIEIVSDPVITQNVDAGTGFLINAHAQGEYKETFIGEAVLVRNGTVVGNPQNVTDGTASFSMTESSPGEYNFYIRFYNTTHYNNASTGVSMVTVTYPSSGSSGIRVHTVSGQSPDNVEHTGTSVKYVMGGTKAEYEFSGNEVPVLAISFDAKDNEGAVVAKVQTLRNMPSGIPYPPGDSYNLMSINVGNEGTISEHNAENILINFKVSWEWITDNNIDISTIHLARYHDETWQDLPTIQISDDGEFLYFTAETPGFSIFSVVGDSVNEIVREDKSSSGTYSQEENQIVEDKETPGFTAITSFMLIAVVLLLNRKRK